MRKTVNGEYTFIQLEPNELKEALYEYTCKKEPGKWSQYVQSYGAAVIDLKVIPLQLGEDEYNQAYTTELRICVPDAE